MLFSRREILKNLLVAPFVTEAALSNNESIESDTVTNTALKGITQSEIILPKALEKGSKVAITAPASPSSPGEVAGLVSLLKRYGIESELGNTIKVRKSAMRYLSASDDERLSELMGYFERDDIDAIFCARGGYGVMRILDKIDYNIIKNHPKIVIGYSDITALLLAIFAQCGLVCYHGPVASSQFNEFTQKYLLPLLFKDFAQKDIEYKSSDIEIISKGYAVGRLTGGNLTMVASTLGTPYEIDTKGNILFLEETREEPYKIDRMITQLKLAGKLDVASGIILGNFEYLKGNRNFFPGRSFSTMQVLQDRLNNLNIPIMFGIPFGHMKNKITLPIGVNACIDTDKKSFSIIEPSVC